jgi:hypothetical protein
VDEYGNVLRSAAVGYGRRHPDPDLIPADQAKQGRTRVTLTENNFTNFLDSPDNYRTPLPWVVYLEPADHGNGPVERHRRAVNKGHPGPTPWEPRASGSPLPLPAGTLVWRNPTLRAADSACRHGGTRNSRTSRQVHTWSVSRAAMAGVRRRHRSCRNHTEPTKERIPLHLPDVHVVENMTRKGGEMLSGFDPPLG